MKLFKFLVLFLIIWTKSLYAATILAFTEPSITGEEKIHWYSTTDSNYSVIVSVPNGGMSNIRFSFQGADSPTLYMRIGPINTSIWEAGHYSFNTSNINLTLSLRDPNLRTIASISPYLEFTILEVQNTAPNTPPSVFAANAIFKRQYSDPETHIYIRHNSDIPIPIIPESSTFFFSILSIIILLLRRR